MYLNHKHNHRHGVTAQSSSPSPLGAEVATIATTQSCSTDSDNNDDYEDDGSLVMRTTVSANASGRDQEGAQHSPNILSAAEIEPKIPNVVATSNFDANYLATLGKDGESIEICVDNNRKRAS
ncbi:hypothetical protein GGF42_008595, partial [Coemansia sp. RSA 2424]